MKKARSYRLPFKFESAALSEMKNGQVSNISVIETFEDNAGVQPDQVSAGSSHLGGEIDDIKSIGNFLSRPVRIFADKWDMMPSNPTVTLSVWDLWSKEPNVRAKLKNFAYLKGDLKVRVAVSGTPFHYGKFLLSYQPYPLRNAVLVNYPNVPVAKNLYLSQAPGSYLMDVRENKPVDITCPFISTKQAHRLWNTNGTVAEAASFEDLSEAGSLYITSPTGIRAVNGNTDAPYMQIYAWMENMHLGPPTATMMEIKTESKKEEDTGPVERVSGQIARVAGQLEDIPYIGPFATASKVAFGALNKVSSLFGWSRPVVIENTMFVKNNPYQSPVCIGSDTSQKITFDPYQGLSVDPAICGGSGDQMAITEIAKIESLFSVIEWDTDMDPFVIMASHFVTPMLSHVTTVNGATFVQPTAMAFAAAPFAFWRGTIRFTIDVVCTQFHRGKFIIGYEPNTEGKAQLDTQPIKLNKQFQRVIDIQDTQRVSFDVEWNSYREWLGTSTLPLGTLPSTQAPGYIYISPFTELISPDSTSHVYLILSVSCPDLQVMGILAGNLPTTKYFPEAEDFGPESKHEIDASIESSIVKLAPSTAKKGTETLEHFGEEIISFRTLLKRFNPVYSFPAAKTTNTEGDRVDLLMPTYPMELTYSASTPAVNTNWLEYLRYAYLGMRGGTRFRFQFCVPDMADDFYIVAGLRGSGGVPTPTRSVTALDNTGSLLREMVPNIFGQSIFYRDSNGGVEVEIPFYSNNLFAFAFADDYVGSNPGNQRNMSTNWFRGFRCSYVQRPSNFASNVMVMIATAEDFSLNRYQGAPWYTVQPPP